MIRKVLISVLIFSLYISLGTAAAYSQASLINDITYNTSAQYRSGDTVEVTLRGEPGDTATFDVGDVKGISMTEVTPGVYVGNYTIPLGTVLSNAQIVGHLQKGDRVDSRVTLMPISTVSTLTITPGATVVTNLRPNNQGSYVTTKPAYIFIKHATLDPFTAQNLKVYFDGQDVTAFSSITQDSVGYAPPIPFSIGDHHVDLIGVNRIGQHFQTDTWFTIAAEGTPTSGIVNPIGISTSSTTIMTSGTSPTTITATTVSSLLPSSLSMVKVFDNATTPANVGDTMTVTLLGRPGGIATFDVGSTTGIPMTELSPGAYVGTYKVQNGDNFNNAILTGHLALRDGENLFTNVAAINPPGYYASTTNGAPGFPYLTILSPNSGAQVSPPFVISGMTTPNTDVILTSQNANGVQQTITVRSDNAGNFSTTVNAAQTGSGTQYVITAVPRDSGGNLGESATITVVQP